MLRPPSNPPAARAAAEAAGEQGAPPPEPLSGALMAERRTVMVAARVTPAEHAAWQSKAAAAGVSPSARASLRLARAFSRASASDTSAMLPSSISRRRPRMTSR